MTFKAYICLALIALFILAPIGSALAGGGAGKSIQIFQIYQSGGATLSNADAAKFAKYDMFSFNRNRYYQMTPNTYDAVKAINPDVIIFNYQQGPDTWTSQDGSSVLNVNNIVRYNNTYGHSMGNLNTNNPSFFLLDTSGQRIHTYGKSYRYLLDFGSAGFQAYWLEATEADVVDQPWRPDGIFIDNCMPTWGGGYWCDLPAKYQTNADWVPAMISFHTALTAGLHARGLQVWTNTGHINDYTGDGYDAWLTIDADPNHPDFMAEEGAFVHGWSGDASFYDEGKWKMQVDMMTELQNSSITQFAHCGLPIGGSGTDTNGKPVTFWDALWYGMGSFFLGKNDVLDNAYFQFHSHSIGYTIPYWFDEYDQIDLGDAVGDYQKTTIGSSNIYWREFEKAYVFVNPSSNDVPVIPLAQPCKQLSHATINDDPEGFADVTSISLESHRAAILVKSSMGNVAGRQVFYNNSAWDGNDPAANVADDAAIATNKSPLLGGTATFANYTSFSKGINGIMVDIDFMAGVPSASDFSFRVGNDSDLSLWVPLVVTPNVSVRAGEGTGGADRVTIILPDGTAGGEWLEVTVKATANTDLLADDVFYFGNAVGDTGNSLTDAEVTPTDEIYVRNNPATLAVSSASISHAADFNRDKKVGPTDAILCRNNGTNSSTALQLITPNLDLIFFADDFEDNDLVGWTDLAGSFETFQFIGQTNYEAHALSASSRMRADLTDTNLPDTTYMSLAVRHTGGAEGGSNTGNKAGHIWFVDDSGAGFGLYIILSQTGAGLLDIYSTTDDGATISSVGNYTSPPAAGGNDLKQIELVYNRIADEVECFYDGSSVGTVAVSSAYRNFTRVVVSLADMYISFGDPVIHIWGQLDFDDISISNSPLGG